MATPIGNLEDITLRAIRILEEVNLIAAEDTRHTLKLLNHFNIKKPLVSYYKQNERGKSEVLIEKLLSGENIALVSDAGTPGISDPGECVIKSAVEKGIEIVPVPGACALVNALIVSGVSTQEFCFIGFLPVKRKEKNDKLGKYANLKQTLILYEAPHKLVNTLECIYDVFGDRQVAVVKELTKIHEGVIRGRVSEVLNQIEEPKGEYVIVVEGAQQDEAELELEVLVNLTLEEHLQFYLNQGVDKKEAIKKIAKDRNVKKNEVYQYFLGNRNI